MEHATRQRRRRQVPALATLLAGLLILTGCQGSDQVTKAGAQAAPITLRMGTDDGPGRPAADQIEQFAREVAARADGRLRIEPVWRAAGDTGDDDWDQKVARMVVSGELDLGNIPSRAWDTEGVTSLRALNAPLLVTSDAQVERIVTSDLSATMLAGLGEVGVEGLALLPEGMRRVFWFDEPQPSVDTFQDAFLRVPASATTYATFEELGARPDDATASSADVDGAETSFLLVPAVGRGLTSTTVGNLPLWPKVNTIVANQARMRGLPEDLQSVLRDAAAATRTWAVGAIPKDADAARAFCDAGGTVVLADDSEVEAFRRATAPVIDDLERDATTAELIAAIEALEPSGSRREDPADCRGGDAVAMQGAGAAVSARPGDEGAFPQGEYRYKLVADALRDAGLSEEDVRNNAGIWTWTLRDGRWSFTQAPSYQGVRTTSCEGSYEDLGDQVVGFTTITRLANGDCAPEMGWTARWTKRGDLLVWSDVSVADFVPVFVGPGWNTVT
jgi:TRAP-type C4-dicarboxylate transport system substrate-binding protein